MEQDNKIKANENKNTFIYAFKQQIMKAWQPVPTIYSTVILFLLLGLFFLGFGIALIILTQQIVESTHYYDEKCTTVSAVCNVSIQITEKMEAPVFFYYQLENFYQNHRRYVKSRDVDQLKGTIKSVSDLSSTCTPVTTMKELGIPGNKVLNGTLNDDDPANPCGLIAKSFFNDTYVLLTNNSNPVSIDETGIAWPSDRENKFQRPTDYQKIQWHDVMDEHFMVWMRTAALSNFRKLWGRINETLEVGTYTLQVLNNYDVSKFSGKKAVVLSTTNAFGGKNMFLAVAYLVVGGICIFIALVFSAKKIMSSGKNLPLKNK